MALKGQWDPGLLQVGWLVLSPLLNPDHQGVRLLVMPTWIVLVVCVLTDVGKNTLTAGNTWTMSVETAC